MIFHKAMVIILIAFTAVFTCFALKMNPIEPFLRFQFLESLKVMYILGFTVAFWVNAYIEVVDYVRNRIGLENKLLKEQAGSLQKDLVVTVLSAVFLSFVYWFDSSSYSFTSVDVGAAALPFLLSSLYAIFQLFSVKIAGKPLRKTPLLFYSGIVFLTLGFLVYTLIKTSSGEYSTIKSIWYQVTFLSLSFCLFMHCHQQLFFLRKGQLGISGFRANLFNGMVKTHENYLKDLPETLDARNKELRTQKAVHSARIRKQGKQGKR